MGREIRSEPTTEGVMTWLHGHRTLKIDREPWTNMWVTMRCPQCDHESGGYLHKDVRRDVWACNFSECDGAIMVTFAEPGDYDPAKAKVYVLDATNRWVRVEDGMHQHVMVIESRTNPRWMTGDGLVYDSYRDYGVHCDNILPDGEKRGVREQHRAACSCGWSTDWQPYAMTLQAKADPTRYVAMADKHLTETEGLVSA
jgi:hypothetical protein